MKRRNLRFKRLVMQSKKKLTKVYSQGTINVSEIWVDMETGVNYFYHAAGYSGGLSVLLDEEGKPIVTPKEKRDSL